MIKKFLRHTLYFCASLQLTIFILAVAAIIFTLQSASSQLTAILKTWKWLEAIPVLDFYHSNIFIVLLILFCINLLACSLKRLPKTLHLLSRSSEELNEKMMASLPLVAQFTVKDFIKSSEALMYALTSHFKKPTVTKKEHGQLNLYAEKGRYTHLGFYLAHLSILVFALGVMISTTGYVHSFIMLEGQVLDPVVVRDGKRSSKNLDFSLLCEDFNTIYYPGSSRVKTRQSVLTILNNGKKVKTETVDFAHRLQYNGITIYQDPYSEEIQYARIKVVSPGGKAKVYEVKSGNWFTLEENGIRIRATQFEPNAVKLKSGLSPAIVWVSYSPVRFYDDELRGYQFSLIETFKREATRLKIVKSRGKEVIWYSFFSMIMGFIISFFLFHQRVWAKVAGNEGECTITLAGSATRSTQSLEKLFNAIQNELRKVSP